LNVDPIKILEDGLIEIGRMLGNKKLYVEKEEKK